MEQRSKIEPDRVWVVITPYEPWSVHAQLLKSAKFYVSVKSIKPQHLGEHEIVFGRLIDGAS